MYFHAVCPFNYCKCKTFGEIDLLPVKSLELSTTVHVPRTEQASVTTLKGYIVLRRITLFCRNLRFYN